MNLWGARRWRLSTRGTKGAFGCSGINRFFRRHGVTIAMQCAWAEIRLINTARARSGVPRLTRTECDAIYASARETHGDKLVTT